MKYGFLGWVVVMAAGFSPLMVAAEPSVVIRIERWPRNPAHGSVTTYRLSRGAEGIRCGGEGVPEHRIHVRGLKILNPPMKGEQISPGCSHVVSWGEVRVCYVPGVYPVLDDVLRGCAGI